MSPLPRCKHSQNTKGQNGAAQPPILEVRKLRPRAAKDLVRFLECAEPGPCSANAHARYIYMERSLQK